MARHGTAPCLPWKAFGDRKAAAGVHESPCCSRQEQGRLEVDQSIILLSSNVVMRIGKHASLIQMDLSAIEVWGRVEGGVSALEDMSITEEEFMRRISGRRGGGGGVGSCEAGEEDEKEDLAVYIEALLSGDEK